MTFDIGATQLRCKPIKLALILGLGIKVPVLCLKKSFSHSPPFEGPLWTVRAEECSYFIGGVNSSSFVQRLQ